MDQPYDDILETRKKFVFTESTSSQRTSVASAVRRIEMSLRNSSENSSIVSKQRQMKFHEADKENRVRYSDGSVSITKSIKMRYEELSNSRKSTGTINASQNSTTSGAIKKKIVNEKKIENQSEKSFVTRKRVTVYEDDDFVKSRFKIYSDKKPKIVKETVGKKDESTSNNGATKETIKRNDRWPQNKNLTSLRLSVEANVGAVQNRSTPIDVPVVPLIPKKVKIEHRRGSNKPIENSETVIISHGLKYKVPYVDDFIIYEMEKDVNSVPKVSMGYRRRNVTVKQRNLLVTFLTRVNAHSFYPSFFLYQTVKIFDAALDARPIAVEELQLTALTCMWIVMKKDHNVYGIPSAEKMILLANGLYANQKDLLLKCEREVLQSLNFDISYPDPFSFLCYNISTSACCHCMNDHQIDTAYYCGGYMIDLSLFDEELLNISAILLAAAVSETALYFVLEEVKGETEPMWEKYRAPHVAKKFTESEINHVRSRLIEKINESTRRHSDGEIIFKKYSRTRYGKIAQILGHQVRKFLAMDSTIDLKE